MPPKGKVKQAVWIKAAGRCAICRDILCFEALKPELTHFVGDVAHIVAESEDGPRGQSTLSLEERNLESNLILLCPDDHRKVDLDTETYTVEKLDNFKQKHETWITSSLSVASHWETKLHHLYYINIPRLSLLAAVHGCTIDLSKFGEIRTLHSLGLALVPLMNGFQTLLQTIELRAIPLREALKLTDPRGAIVSFNENFRTKNISIPNRKNNSEAPFSGNRAKDPHIYRKLKEFTVVSNIDFRWITTTTAFCSFRPSSGQNRFAGLGIISGVDSPKTILMTPFVIGMPSNEYIEEFERQMRRHSRASFGLDSNVTDKESLH